MGYGRANFNYFYNKKDYPSHQRTKTGKMKLRLFTVALIAVFNAHNVSAIRLAEGEAKEVELDPAGGTKCVSLGDKPAGFPAGCCEDDKPLADRV